MVTSGSSVIHEERILSWPFETIILAVFLTGSLVATVVVQAHHRYVIHDRHPSSGSLRRPLALEWLDQCPIRRGHCSTHPVGR